LKLATFRQDGRLKVGVVEGDELVDLASGDDRLPGDLASLLALEQDLKSTLAGALACGRRRPLAQVRLAAPIPSPRKFLGLGHSFRSQVDAVLARGGSVSSQQVWFNKQVTCVAGPYDPVHLPTVVHELDYEGEVALVIGRRARHVRRQDAARYVGGFMICNDVSARDWVRRSPTAMLGKSFDTHGPIGPWLTTPDEVDGGRALRIRTWVDGELRQDGGTEELLFSFGEMIEELSSVFTLEPGDILSTGTPAGSGASLTPPRFLAAGQTVRVEVDGLGRIENLIVPEPHPAAA
jgi:2-keto-4-pentenoate hydratase/2-oxohepta-3-ene-1,7-dioic acid hydratase in catechol pathway